MALLSIDGLRTEVRREGVGVLAVRGVSLEIEAGEAVGLVGESGCGKTMTALSIMGLLPHGAAVVGGSVTFAGTDLVQLGERQLRAIRGNRISMIFQDPMSSLNPTMTIGRQIGEVVRLHQRCERSEAMASAVAALDRVGIPNPARRANAYPHELSGGQRQRVMIAIAIACRPALLIADEPTTALDVTVQREVLDVLDELRAELGMAMILVSHDLEVVARRVDRVVAMYAGAVVEHGPSDDVFSAPRHPYLGALLETMPERALAEQRPIRPIAGRPPDPSALPPGCSFSPRCANADGECLVTEPPLLNDESAASGRRAVACWHPRTDVAIGALAVPSTALRTLDAPNLLEVDNVSKVYAQGALFRRRGDRVTAVDGVTFAVRRGETFGVVGESGSGKSTLGRLIVGIERATSGSIRLAPEAAVESAAGSRASSVGPQMVFQDSSASLDPRLDVGSIISEPLVIHRRGDRRWRHQRVAELLDAVGLPKHARHRYPHEFSGGQRQRISIARALALHPRLIVADEPVSALDVSVQAQILTLLDELATEHTLTFMFISHDLAVIRYLADRVGVMYAGRLVEVGPAAHVWASPAHHYTRLLLDSVPGQAERASEERSGVRRSVVADAVERVGCVFAHRCPAVTERCRTQRPALGRAGSSGEEWLVACHHPLGGHLMGVGDAR